MLLAVNIGNTNTVFGLQTATQLIFFRILTKECDTSLPIEQGITSFLKEHSILSQQITGCIISSVVPAKNPVLIKTLHKITGLWPNLVTSSMDFCINISQYDCSLIGTDRLLCCMAAYDKFKAPFIVFDLGTATTANVVNQDGFYLGGAILAGIDTGLQALTSGTALIPKAIPTAHVPLIGKNTNECLLSGALYQTAGFIDRYIDDVSEELDQKTIAVITGGNATRVMPFLKADTVYCPNLLLEGLILLDTKLNFKSEEYHE